MKRRTPLFSASPRAARPAAAGRGLGSASPLGQAGPSAPRPGTPAPGTGAAAAAKPATAPSSPPARPGRVAALQRWAGRHPPALWALAGALMATSALPAYAMSPELAAFAGVGSLDPSLFAADAETQGLTVTQIGLQNYKRGTAKDISAEELFRQQTITAYRDYAGPTAEDYLLNPPFPTYNTEKVMQVAAKYVGVPYVFGGETPAGFDCSGYVKFVFSQFGIALPHSVNGQARMGKIINPEDALPGDLVIMNDHSHDGIYAGNGMFYHAPLRGDKVKLAPIFTPKHYFVRLGIDG